MGPKNNEKQAQETNIFFIIMTKNYKRTRGHKRSVFKYSLHVNNREIDQEKQNKLLLVES